VDDAAEVRRSLKSRGAGIGMAHRLIAGIVRANDGLLLTRNVAHFEGVAGLSLSRAGREAAV
jgi:predicted nucleic acid-binding protein